MDTVAGPRAKQKLGRPLIPPNYVSLRHLQELRLKEEEQRQREEEEAAARVREEQRRREEEEAAERRRVVEEQRRRDEEEAAARRRVLEEQRRREEEEAAARRVKEAAAAAPMKPSSSSNTSFGYKERSRGGQRSVVVAHRRRPPSRGEGTAMKSDGATGGCHGQKGPDGDAANAPLGTGRKAQNEGKEKDKVLATISGGSGEPTGEATASLYGGNPEEKKKVEASGYQGSASGMMSSAPGELAEAGIGSHRGSGRQKHKHKGKKGLDGRSIEIALSSMTGKQDSSPPRGINSENIEKGSGEPHTGTASSGALDVSPPSGAKSEKIGKNKPSEGMCADMVPSSNMRYRKTAKTRPTVRSNRRSSGGQGLMWEAKSEGLGEKQTVVEVSAQSQTSAEGCNNRRMEVKSESSGKKQLMVKVVAQPCLATEDSSNRRRDSGQGTIREAKCEGLDEKQPVVEVRATAQWKLWRVRHSHERLPGGGSGVAGEHGGVWVPKATAVRDSANM